MFIGMAHKTWAGERGVMEEDRYYKYERTRLLFKYRKTNWLLMVLCHSMNERVQQAKTDENRGKDKVAAWTLQQADQHGALNPQMTPISHQLKSFCGAKLREFYTAEAPFGKKKKCQLKEP